MDREIEFLDKSDNKTISLDVLRGFRQLGEIAECTIDAPEPLKSVFESWYHFRLLAVAMTTKEIYPTLTRCWKDVQARFARFFQDETFLDMWCFLDFPCKDGKSYGECFAEDCENEKKSLWLLPFVKEMSKTRLGFYQIVLATKEFIRLKEIISDRVIDVYNTVDEYEAGEIFLIRIFPILDKQIMLGDPMVFPKEKKCLLEDILFNKAFDYYTQATDDRLMTVYERHMKLSGPYWMSVGSSNPESEILKPNHYLRYFESGS